MSNPYLITGPALISFSGGRTSGYMLKHVLDAHGGALPDDVHVCFANTGRERVETLDFVRDCEAHWNCRVVWLEYRYIDGAHTFESVSHNSASRDGEPFAELLRARRMLPNPMTRFCTQELKIRVMKKYMIGQGYATWTNAVGLRADEPGRVGRLLDAEKRKERFSACAPLAAAGVTERDVLAWWAKQAFNLRLRSYEGNCDLCFLKGAGKITAVMRDRPDLARWWIEQERWRVETEGLSVMDRPEMALFRADRPSYAAMLDATQRQGVLPFSLFDDHQSCEIGCTDQEPEAELCDLRAAKRRSGLRA